MGVRYKAPGVVELRQAVDELEDCRARCLRLEKKMGFELDWFRYEHSQG